LCRPEAKAVPPGVFAFCRDTRLMGLTSQKRFVRGITDVDELLFKYEMSA
jgi:hypothetical protein